MCVREMKIISYIKKRILEVSCPFVTFIPTIFFCLASLPWILNINVISLIIFLEVQLELKFML